MGTATCMGSAVASASGVAGAMGANDDVTGVGVGVGVLGSTADEAGTVGPNDGAGVAGAAAGVVAIGGTAAGVLPVAVPCAPSDGPTLGAVAPKPGKRTTFEATLCAGVGVAGGAAWVAAAAVAVVAVCVVSGVGGVLAGSVAVGRAGERAAVVEDDVAGSLACAPVPIVALATGDDSVAGEDCATAPGDATAPDCDASGCDEPDGDTGR
ncbi:hypothetical protein GXB81_31020 [Paraburkholderia sp. Ac-20336]|nr:hypothetical protein [Paraburkholderia sp. Ac-20336]